MHIQHFNQLASHIEILFCAVNATLASVVCNFFPAITSALRLPVGDQGDYHGMRRCRRSTIVARCGSQSSGISTTSSHSTPA
jgi:hypothetical protein